MNCAGYPVELRPSQDADNSGWIALVPEHPQYMAYGATQREALARLDQKIARLSEIPLFNPELNLSLRS